MNKFKASLIATGVGAALAMALSGPALAGEEGGHMHHGSDPGNTIHNVADSAVATDHASATSVQLGDVSVGVYSASTALSGTVQNNGSDGIRGNDGGSAGGAGFGGVGNSGGTSAHAHSTAIGGEGGDGGGVGGWDNGNQGGAGAGGNARGAVSSGALALAATGNGAMGGNGGSADGGPAGRFVVSNSIANSSFASAAGIMNVSQNMGANSLTQQGVTVQGNVSFR